MEPIPCNAHRRCRSIGVASRLSSTSSEFGSSLRVVFVRDFWVLIFGQMMIATALTLVDLSQPGGQQPFLIRAT